MSRKLMYNPGVSVCLIPLDDNMDEELFLTVGEDYSMGKLVRCGLDAVYGINSRGKKIYDSGKVRRLLYDINDHIDYFNEVHSKYAPIMRQGHGNIGLNNWAVGYINDGTTKQLVVPSGEPIMERVYPSFIKYSKNWKKAYEIQDIMYFYENTDSRETLAWSEIEKKIVEIPDCEIDSEFTNSVFLPVWDEKYSDNQYLGLTNNQINYNKFKDIKFVEVKKAVVLKM